MTQALDAAVRAYCEYDEQVTNCPYPKCKCDWQGNAVRAALRAALPAEPPEWFIPWFYDYGKRVEAWPAWEDFRAHLLGEDDITEDRRPWDEYAGEDA